MKGRQGRGSRQHAAIYTTIPISSSWISVACASCCDWDKLWLLVILWKISLIMLSWYPFFFITCFILAFSLCKSYLFVIIEYALLKKEETTLSLLFCNLFGGESCSVGIGQYVQASYIPIQRSLHYSVSIKCQEMLVLHYFLPP